MTVIKVLTNYPNGGINTLMRVILGLLYSCITTFSGVKIEMTSICGMTRIRVTYNE